MKRKVILSLVFILTLTGGINLSIKKNYASDNEITELAKSLTETANKIIPNSSLIKYVNDTLVFFNGEQVADLSIYNYNNSTYLPLRAIGDLLGAKVNWFAQDMVAQVSLDNTQIEVLNNTNTVVVKKDDNIEESKITATSNGQSVDLPALNIKGTIYLPLRYISETLGVNIDYTSNHEKTGVKTIEIYKGNKPELNYVRDIPLFPVKVESAGYGWGYFGFIDNTGKLVIPKIYNALMSVKPEFSEGFAVVYNNGKYFYVDKTGKPTFPYMFGFGRDFSEGLAGVYTRGDNGYLDKGGFIDKTGELVIPYQFKEMGDFKEGLAKVKDFNSKWGYVDRNGKIVIPYQYFRVQDFSEGLALVENIPENWNEIEDDKLFEAQESKYIDKTGKTIIPDNPKLEYLESFSEGLALAQDKDYNYKFIDKTGKVVINVRKDIYPDKNFSEGLVAVMDKNGKYGYMDKSGKIVIPCQYDFAENFSEGLALVGIKTNPDDNMPSQYGYIDKTGKMIIPYIKASSVFSFKNGLAYVIPEEGRSYYMDKTGKKISNYYLGK